MRAKNVALFFIGIAFAIGAPSVALAAKSIISQSSGVSQPYTAWVGANITINDSRFFVATGTLTSISFPAAAFRTALSGTETFQFKLHNYYFGQWIDCQTPVKTMDEWGITHTPKDPYAPVVTFGPFTGTQCDIPVDTHPGPTSIMTWPIRDGQFEGTDVPGMMGNGFNGNFTAYGIDVPDPDPCAVPGACASNVLFLPGIQGSRLYEGTGCGKSSEEKLWEPYEGVLNALRGVGNDKMRDLFLNASGDSECNDIYAKENDVIDAVGGSNIYKTFIDEMNALKSAGDINDWKAVAYDWRLSLDDLMNNGTARPNGAPSGSGKIFYEEATSTPYIEQTLRALAGSSKTGKVSIVAHSNGGLVAKKLLDKLGSGTAESLVDKVIMVGAPQSGAPEALGAALVGYSAGIYKLGFPIVSNTTAQEFAKNSPMTYHLLPSSNYLASIASDENHPVARFAGDGYAAELAAYGATINNTAEMDDFMRAESLNSSLIDYANTTHGTIDAWVPPAGITVSQIAGWGADTVAGIDFFTPPAGPSRWYRPIFTEDGDGVVPVSSALMMASSTSVKKYWVDLNSYLKDTRIKVTHRDIFEIPSLETFLKNLIKNSASTLPAYISTTQPAPTTENKKLTFFLHSPLTLQLTDSSGNVTGIGTDDSMTQDIPDSSYGEFGEVKYVTVPTGNYQLTMHGQASGTFALEMQETSDGVVTASSTITNVPTADGTLASLTISGGLDTVSKLTVDVGGGGSNVITLTPVLGEYVNYVRHSHWRPSPVIAGGSSADIEIATTSPIADEGLRSASTTTATTTPQIIATSTPEVATSTTIVPPKRKVKAVTSVAPPKKISVTASQTASVYDASQQLSLRSIGTRLYTGFYRMWIALKNFF